MYWIKKYLLSIGEKDGMSCTNVRKVALTVSLTDKVGESGNIVSLG